MYSNSFQDRIELLQFQSFRSILLVLGGYIPGSARFSTVLVFGTLHDNLYSLVFRFLRHCYMLLIIFGLQRYDYISK